MMAVLHLRGFTLPSSASQATITGTKANSIPRNSPIWHQHITEVCNYSRVRGQTPCTLKHAAKSSVRGRPLMLSTTARAAAMDLSEAAKSAERQPVVKGTFVYTKPPAPEEQPFIYVGGNPPEGTPVMNLGSEFHEVDILNIRTLDEQPTMEQNGFELISLKSPITCNFEDEEEVQKVLYPVIRDAVKEVTGASRVVMIRHQQRMRPKDAAKGRINTYVDEASESIPPREPVSRPHCDYSEESGAKYLQDFFGEGTGPPPIRRGAVVNFWMITNGPTLDAPLAMCDPRTVAPADRNQAIIHVLAPGPPRDTTAYFPTFDPSHKWYYAPNMGPREALIFKGYDTEEGRPHLTPHASFHYPNTSDDDMPRESIECRMVLAWD